MSLDKLLATISLATALTFFPQKVHSQNPLSAATGQNITAIENTVTFGLVKPKEKLLVYADIFVQRKKESEETQPIHLGKLEIRDHSMYACVLFGYYQILFEQVNDSTFTEQIYSRPIIGLFDRHEILTTKRRKNTQGDYYLVLTDYTTIKGKEREEKTILKGKKFSPEYITTIDALKQFFSSNLPEKINLVVLGEPYTFTKHEQITDIEKETPKYELAEITQYVQMSEVNTTKYNTFIMKDDFNVTSTRETVINNSKSTAAIKPEKFNAKFQVLNLKGLKSFLNGNYDAIGIVRE